MTVTIQNFTVYGYDIHGIMNIDIIFRFKEIKEKVNITWHDNKTISYLQKLHYYFDKENSERNWNDVITTINMIPLVSTGSNRHFDIFFSKPSSNNNIFIAK